MKRLVVTASLCGYGALAFMSVLWCGCDNLSSKPDVPAIESAVVDDAGATSRETTADDSVAFEAQERAKREAQERAEREAQERAEREAQERAEREAQERAERKAQKQAEEFEEYKRYMREQHQTEVYVDALGGIRWRRLGASEGSGGNPGYSQRTREYVVHKRCYLCNGSGDCPTCESFVNTLTGEWTTPTASCSSCRGTGRCRVCDGSGFYEETITR